MKHSALVEVAVAIVRDPAGRVLMAERSPRQIAAGYWELPGGKIERGESPIDAARRELREEAGLDALEVQPWTSYDFRFPARALRLHVFLVTRWSGSPRGCEGNRLAWVDPTRPDAVGLVLPSNRRALALLTLPSLAEVVALRQGGITATSYAPASDRLLLLRGGTPGQRVQGARTLIRRGARVLVEGTPLEAVRAQAHGLVSPHPEWWHLAERPPVDLWAVVCAEPAELAHAAARGADLALLFAPPASADARARLAAVAPLPVFVPAPDAPVLVRLDRLAAPARAFGAAAVRPLEPRRAALGGASP